MWKTILEIFFPIHCLGCNQEGNFICLTCFKNLPLNTEKPQNNLLIASYYNNPLIKQIIHRYKYDFVKDLAKPLGLLMTKRLVLKMMPLAEQGRHFQDDASGLKNLILIPIPLHKKRLRWRGFNQTELLAQHIGQALNIPVINNLLIRTKNTLPQVKIENAIQRRENINQAFELKKPLSGRGLPFKMMSLAEQERHFKGDASELKNKTLILIDDVSTTGATLDQAAQALLPLNPKQIWKLIVARG